ncbi:hypothetical protein V8C42DRAFT_222279 [Trichoderma barbatum]
MKSLKLKNKMSRYLDMDRVLLDNSSKTENRRAASTSNIQFAELPPKSITISPQRRIMELNDEIRQLTCELDYYKNLTDDVLLRIMPIILYHSGGLFSTVQKCHTSIEQANSQRMKFWK